jgi:hypothetical protein
MSIKKMVLIAVMAAAVTVAYAEDNADKKSSASELPKVMCPLKPDPPPVVDGELNEWQNVPGTIEITPAQVRWGKPKWKDEDDLGGTFHMCWDQNYLYLAAEVIDDKIMVSHSGNQLWMSDHIEFDIDVDWKTGVKGEFGKKQFVFGFSPGNFQNTGDPLNDITAEFYVFRPAGIADNAEIDVASKRTEDGYTLEVRIPWKFFGISPKQGDTIAFDIHFSDSDDALQQETMTSLYPAVWKGRKRERMIPVVLGDTSGKVKK